PTRRDLLARRQSSLIDVGTAHVAADVDRNLRTHGFANRAYGRIGHSLHVRFADHAGHRDRDLLAVGVGHLLADRDRDLLANRPADGLGARHLLAHRVVARDLASLHLRRALLPAERAALLLLNRLASARVEATDILGLFHPGRLARHAVGLAGGVGDLLG